MSTETNTALLFQLAMAAKMIETRHRPGCNWSVEMVVRDAAGRVIMHVGDEPQSHWQGTIPEDSDEVSHELAAGQASREQFDQAVELSGMKSADYEKWKESGRLIDPGKEWPGPDWSQAPADAIGWVAQNTRAESHKALWVFGPGYLNEGGIWTTDYGYRLSESAPLFGYPGDWRDSLRKRPEPTS